MCEPLASYPGTQEGPPRRSLSQPLPATRSGTEEPEAGESRCDTDAACDTGEGGEDYPLTPL